jgi:putative transposase
MASTFINVWVHVVFSTKDREPLLGPILRPRICAYLAGIAQNCGARVSCINGIEDHVHILTSLPSTISIADYVRTLKSNSSGWVHEEWPAQYFAWQSGYGAFSVSRSNLDGVRQYVEQQEEHHKRMSFREEFLALLKKHQVEYDERYIWR